MKFGVAVLLAFLSASAIAGARVVVPSLPELDVPDAEVVTNFLLNVNAERLERLTIAVSLDSCVTNEVLARLTKRSCLMYTGFGTNNLASQYGLMR